MYGRLEALLLKLFIMAGKGLQAPKNLSPELEAIVGPGPMSRPQVTKKLWEYIKANNLQDSTDKRLINPDAKLATVLGSEQVHMMQIAKKVSAHLS